MPKEIPKDQIDTIEDFVYDSENEQYNRDYLQWRRHTKSPIIYRFKGHIKENVYVAGAAVTKQDAAMTERNALMRCGEVIGAALLLYLVAELIGGSLLIGLLRIFHVDIRLDFLTLSMEGSQWPVTVVRSFVMLLKYGMPAFVMIHHCQLPKRVVCPRSIGAMPETVAAVGGAMIIAGIYSLTAHGAGLEAAQQLFTYKDTLAISVYGLFEVLVISMLAELLLRGSILPLVRQFGDGFAVAVTAAIAFLFPNALPERISELLIGLVSGYLLIRSGSIFKCVLLRAVYSALTYARLMLVYANHTIPLWQFALLLLAIGTLAAATFVSIRRGHVQLLNRQTALSEPIKIIALTQSVTLLPWLAVSVLFTLLQLFY